MLERACELDLIARTLGEPPVPIAQAAVDGVAKHMKAARAKPEFGQHEWNALVRVIDKKGSDYRS